MDVELFYADGEAKLNVFKVKNVGVNSQDKLITVCGTTIWKQHHLWDKRGAEVAIDIEDALVNFSPEWAYCVTADGKKLMLDLQKTAKANNLGAGVKVSFATDAVEKTPDMKRPGDSSEIRCARVLP